MQIYISNNLKKCTVCNGDGYTTHDTYGYDGEHQEYRLPCKHEDEDELASKTAKVIADVIKKYHIQGKQLALIEQLVLGKKRIVLVMPRGAGKGTLYKAAQEILELTAKK